MQGNHYDPFSHKMEEPHEAAWWRKCLDAVSNTLFFT